MPQSRPPTGSTPSRPLSPPRRVWVSVASLVAAIALVRWGLLEQVVGSIVDQAVRNIITLILGFAAAMSVLVWFLRESGHAARLKRAVDKGLFMGAYSPESIAQFLQPLPSWPKGVPILDGREHLSHVRVTSPDISAYGALLTDGGAP